ncbi:MAG: sugar phosphate isomerase/epimerase family protein [Armatimonadota bacterium]
MRLGVAGLLGDGSAEAARRIRDLGFNIASWHLPSLAIARDPAALLAVRDALQAEDLELVQILPPDYPSLVAPDPAEREQGVEALADVISAAVRLQVDNVYVRPGSLNPAGPWTPHPLHRVPETRERLVESLGALCPRAEDAGVRLSLEAHVLSPLYSARAAREVMDAVGSPALAFNADPVNLLGSVEQVYGNTAVIEELFDLLGDRIVTGHAKDVCLGDSLVLHVEEAIPGMGVLDHETFLRRFEECQPRGAVLIEHLPAERVTEARRALLHYADSAGVVLRAG